MITPAYVQTMAGYNSEMNRRVCEAARRLSDDGRRQERGAFFGSIFGTLNHLLWADRMWMSRFDGWEKPSVTQAESPAMIGEWAALAALRVETDGRLEEWAGRVTTAWLGEDLVWFSGDAQREMRAGRTLLVVHLFNHQTHHRGQVHAMLTAAGEATGATDLPWMA